MVSPIEVVPGPVVIPGSVASLSRTRKRVIDAGASIALYVEWG